MPKHPISVVNAPHRLCDQTTTSGDLTDSVSPFEQVSPDVAASLRDHMNFRPGDAATLVGSVTAAPCVWCGELDCGRRFDHARDHAAAESTWRELAEGGAR